MEHPRHLARPPRNAAPAARRARHLGLRRTAESLEQSNALFEEVLADEPGYAAAWAGLAANYSTQARNGLRPIEGGFELARGAANRARQIDPENGFLGAEIDHEVREALVKLPHDYKMVVLLADLEGFAYKEIAEILAVPVGTVMSRLYRGRRMLERSLLSYGTRYNYLGAPPEKLRDAKIDVSEFFTN